MQRSKKNERYSQLSTTQVGEGNIEFRVRHFFKFVFVRHPFVRLVSAYRNKLSDNNPWFERTYGSRILRYTRPNLTEKVYTMGKGECLYDVAVFKILAKKYIQQLCFRHTTRVKIFFDVTCPQTIIKIILY